MKRRHSLLVGLSLAGALGLAGQALGSTNSNVSVTCKNIPMHECIKTVEGAYAVSISLNTNLEKTNISVDVRQQDALHAVMSVLDTLDKPNYAVMAENHGKRYKVTVFGQGAPAASLQATAPPVEEPESLHRQDGNTVGSGDDSSSEAETVPQTPPVAAAENHVEDGFIPKGEDAPETVEAAQAEMPISAYRGSDAVAVQVEKPAVLTDAPTQAEVAATDAAPAADSPAGSPDNGAPAAPAS